MFVPQGLLRGYKRDIVNNFEQQLVLSISVISFLVRVKLTHSSHIFTFTAVLKRNVPLALHAGLDQPAPSLLHQPNKNVCGGAKTGRLPSPNTLEFHFVVYQI